MRLCPFLPHHITILEKQFYIKRMHINFIESFFHGSKNQFMCRISSASGDAGMPAWHFFVRDNPDIPLGIDGIGANK